MAAAAMAAAARGLVREGMRAVEMAAVRVVEPMAAEARGVVRDDRKSVV